VNVILSYGVGPYEPTGSLSTSLPSSKSVSPILSVLEAIALTAAQVSRQRRVRYSELPLVPDPRILMAYPNLYKPKQWNDPGHDPKSFLEEMYVQRVTYVRCDLVLLVVIRRGRRKSLSYLRRVQKVLKQSLIRTNVGKRVIDLTQEARKALNGVFRL